MIIFLKVCMCKKIFMTKSIWQLNLMIFFVNVGSSLNVKTPPAGKYFELYIPNIFTVLFLLKPNKTLDFYKINVSVRKYVEGISQNLLILSPY